ncbi:MAG: carbamoyltransferase HypF, partial [Thermoleophilia bacterium]|nr:carbamoyltransferase HypF [Thermoleophilia bacterium]
MRARVEIKVSGRVQGVGFRPAIYRYARKCGLAGFVRNDREGVTIEVEGNEQVVASFVEELPRHCPPLAEIAALTIRRLTPRGERSFCVAESATEGPARALLPPDLAVCDACLREMRDPQDRRYRYPFINCIDCGPRFTIVERLPYDRANTSMRGFTLCPECLEEYESPDNRRFHAQPNACPVCGPRLLLLGEGGAVLAEGEAALKGAQQL